MRLRGWSNGSPKQIQYGGRRRHNFGKNINNSGLDRHLASNYMEDAPRRRGDDHVTKSRNRKLIRVIK